LDVKVEEKNLFFFSKFWKPLEELSCRLKHNKISSKPIVFRLELM